MVRAYSLESVQSRLRETRSLERLPCDGAPLCCALSDSGHVFLASNRRTVAVFSLETFREIVTVNTVGVPRCLLYNEIGDYILTLEATDGPAARVPLTDVFAYTKWSLSGQLLTEWQSARTCLIVDADEAEEAKEDDGAAGRGGGHTGVSSAGPQPLAAAPRGPAVHRFRTSGSSPAIAVCPTSGRLAVGDAGAVVVCTYAGDEGRFTVERRVMLPFLAHEVALLAESCCAAVGDSRLVVTWSSLATPGGRGHARASPPPLPLPAPKSSPGTVTSGTPILASDVGAQTLPPPSALLLPSMQRRLHDRHTQPFELTGRDAMSMPLPGKGAMHDPLVLYKRFDDGQEVHSLSLLPMATNDRGIHEAAAFVSTRNAGYLYTVGAGVAQLMTTFSYVGMAFEALISATTLTVCTTTGIELYTSKLCPPKDLALYTQICRDFKDPLLVAMKDVKGLVHCKLNSTTTCYFTDHWQVYENPDSASLSSDLLLLAQELVLTSASSALHVAAEGLRLCRHDGTSMVPASGKIIGILPSKDNTAQAEETIAETYRALCLLAAHSLMTAPPLDSSDDTATDAARSPVTAAPPEECVLMLYDQAGLTSLDEAIGACLAVGSPCAARVVLRLLFNHCGNAAAALSLPSLNISQGVLSLISAHCPESLSHVLLHLANWHQLLLEESWWWTGSHRSKEDDDCSTACMMLSAFYAGHVEDLQAILNGATQAMVKRLTEVLACHPHILVTGNGLSDVAKYLRSNHADLFVTTLLELASKQLLESDDMLCILDNSCGDKSCDKKLYLEELVLISLRTSTRMQLKHVEELCRLLMDDVGRAACTGVHVSRHDSYCLPQITTELAKCRPAWLNEPSLYPAAIHQMCMHKSGAKPSYAASKQSDTRVASISRWLCIVCHSDLLKLQGLLCCGVMDGEQANAVVRSLLRGAAADVDSTADLHGEPAVALSLRLLAAARGKSSPAGSDEADVQHGVTADLVAALAARSPAALPSLLQSLPCVEQREDLLVVIVNELSKQLMTATSSCRDGLLQSLDDVMKLSSSQLTFDQLLAALPPNGSVAYFLPYLEHAVLCQQQHGANPAS